MSTLLEATDLVRHFTGGDGSRVEVLSGASLTMAAGECVAITGASGTGKSTLLHLLGALDRPDRGTVRLEGVSFADLDPDALADVRNRRIGFVFQFHHLLRDFTLVSRSAAATVCSSSIAIVIGPTPPGTGVIIDARGTIASKSMSPTLPCV